LGSLEPYLDEARIDYRLVPYDKLRAELVSQAMEHADDAFRLAAALEKLKLPLRRALGVRRARPLDSSSARLGAVDAGANGRELVIGLYPVITAVGAVFDGPSVAVGPVSATTKLPRLYGDEEEARKLATLVGYYLQFELASKLLPDVGEGVLLDGPLLIRRSVYSPRGRHYTQTYLETYWSAWRSLARLLGEARDADIPVVGVVKRVRSTILSRRVGLDRVGDSSLAALCMSPGEYTSPVPANSGWAELVGHLREAGVTPRGLRPYVVLVKAGHGGSHYRLDVPEYALDRIDGLVSALYSLRAPPTGLPLPIVAVDRLTRVTNREALILHHRMFSSLASKLGATRAELLSLLALRHGEL